ncbi:MAG: RagB/SusD family nutrient uptake outer membrane protein [Paludibacter sp.]|nr:RagB/SusD family nutrient uptake outer membrane protein [Paludibacter sp.]
MKKINKIMVFLFISVFAFEGCSNLLDVDSNRLVLPDGYKMTGTNDTLYSMFGIFSQLEKIADSYVLLGELRGDLMDVTPASNLYLKEINNFDISGTNPYANNIKDYYSVINNCNYVIHNIDTSVVRGGLKIMYKEYAACKAIRAWTYMQIALNFGSANYYDMPILTVQDAENVQKSTPLTITELAPMLINDINPWKDTQTPTLDIIYSQKLNKSFFPIRFVLGDLYLWTGQYENAANEYRDLMFKNSYTITNMDERFVYNGAFTGGLNWFYFDVNSNEDITSIAATNQYGYKFHLDSLTLNREIVPSAVSVTNWKNQPYYYKRGSTALDTVGDLRLYSSVSVEQKFVNTDGTTSISKHGNIKMITPTSKNYILKYLMINPDNGGTNKTSKQIMPYRVPLLYLRYAEAVNRLGKPNLAMAVLKYGLNNSNIQKYVPASEKVSLPNYMNFPDAQFDYYVKNANGNSIHYTNIGIHMRGCGTTNMDTTFYIIPKLLTSQHDSILYVEDLIQKESALETAFLGNRFQDLMRIAIRRDDNEYLANIVSAKNNAIKGKLMVRANWYLKK